MLVAFSCKNWTLFRDRVELDLRATSDDTRRECAVFNPENFPDIHLLKSAVLFGPNASGKTRLLDAFRFLKHFVLHSSKESQQGQKISVQPFRLDVHARSHPTVFEIMFVAKPGLVRFGFEADANRVREEWLYIQPPGSKKREREIYFRKGQDIQVYKEFREQSELLIRRRMIRSNALFLSVAAQFNLSFATEVIEWFDQKLHIVSGLKGQGEYTPYTVHWAEKDARNRARLLRLLRQAETGIVDFAERQFDEKMLEDGRLPEAVRHMLREALTRGEKIFSGVETIHPVFDGARIVDKTAFNLFKDESAGTERLFSLAGPLLHSLDEGHVLLVDEFDARLHTLLAKHLLELFHSSENKSNAQLIGTTHNTLLMDRDLLRRDQIWFLEKDDREAASLYSLADFDTRAVRKNDNYLKKYLSGRFGAIPMFDAWTTGTSCD